MSVVLRRFFKAIRLGIFGLGLSGFAYASSTEVTYVLKLNPGIGNPDLIYPGEEAKLPGGRVLQSQAAVTQVKATRAPSSTITDPAPVETPTAAPTS
jgi:hypothetical protein